MEISDFDRLSSRRAFLQTLAGIGVGTLTAALPGLSLAGTQSPSLQHRVNSYVRKLRRAGRIRSDELTSWSVYDFTTSTKLVSINEEVPRQAASMIKPFVAQAYFYRHKAAPSRYPYSAEVEKLMTGMIRYSRNTATNELMARISSKPYGQRPKEVERVLRKNASGIFRQVEIVEYIPKGGRTYRNKASARDYSRFLYGMWKERLPNAEEMKHLLSLPNNDRIRQGTVQVPRSSEVLDKTGSTAHLCGNMGVVVAQGRDGRKYPYTMIGIIEKRTRPTAYGPWIRNRGNVIRNVSDMVYSELRKTHNLV
ncbi:MAG: serine hydrolase [Pseudomonadota bacterium]